MHYCTVTIVGIRYENDLLIEFFEFYSNKSYIQVRWEAYNWLIYHHCRWTSVYYTTIIMKTTVHIGFLTLEMTIHRMPIGIFGFHNLEL